MRTLRRAAAQEIVRFLHFSNDGSSTGALSTFSTSTWIRALRWLDDAGMTFYFLRKLETAHAKDAIPPWVLACLEKDFAHNRQRVISMAKRFGELNAKFADAGVRFVVLKGFSLTPQFCATASLRHQSDFDYLVDDESLPRAQEILREAGYVARPKRAARESVFIPAGQGAASRGAVESPGHPPHAVELHLDVWEAEYVGIPALLQFFSVQQSVPFVFGELVFPALADEDAFLLQVLHMWGDLFTCWLRMSCLLEIGYFLNHRASDRPLWNRIAQRISGNWVLQDLVVVTVEMATQLFGAPIPEQVQVWSSEIRKPTRVWIDHYAQRAAFCEIPGQDFVLWPGAKLVLFLHQQYRGAGGEKHYVRDRLLPQARLSHLASLMKKNPALAFDLAWWKRQRFLRRSLFHSLAGLRYLCEAPRWLWLNRKTRSFPVQAKIVAVSQSARPQS